MIGPYKTAYEELINHGIDSGKFVNYFKDYMNLFFQAVELTGIYWKMVFELYNPQDNILQITNNMRIRFKTVIQNADLSSPLQKNILKVAKEALMQKNPPKKFAILVKKAKSPLKKETILTVNSADIGKFC